MASALGGATSKSVRSDKGHQALTAGPTDTEWLNRFMTGLRARIGERRRQDAAISISLMLEMQKKLEVRWTRAVESRDTLEMRCVAETGSFFILTYCGSLRGFETPKGVLSDLKKQTLSPEESQENANRGNLVPPHVLLPLQGRFKARSQEMQKRIIDIAWETRSGLLHYTG
jgi:hypothetical protein